MRSKKWMRIGTLSRKKWMSNASTFCLISAGHWYVAHQEMDGDWEILIF
uniref:Uncharacterized protein n=1 Tax=Nelumbo nucifera TaxID=4432 RepID=A0A822Y269_NELNU|nr:TPA_asm: hypothetical protein HUJ06_029452 [Nelumbo nucifera]